MLFFQYTYHLTIIQQSYSIFIVILNRYSENLLKNASWNILKYNHEGQQELSNINNSSIEYQNGKAS